MNSDPRRNAFTSRKPPRLTRDGFARILIGWLRLSARLPWRIGIRLHSLLGLLAYPLLGRHRRMVAHNLRTAFPELDERTIRRLVRAQFSSIGAFIAETAYTWCGRVNATLAPFRIEGQEHVFAALAVGRGVILYTGHFTPVEICAPMLKATFPLFGFMYNPRKNSLLDEFQRAGREYCGHMSFASTNVRAMLRALRDNAVVWYAPDQTFSDKSTVVVPLFGRPARVSSAPWRIARSTGAAIVPFSYRRLPGSAGYLLSFKPAVDFPDPDDELSSTAILATILEQSIRQCPAQYAWTRNFLRREPASTQKT